MKSIILSTAYLPPINYIILLNKYTNIYIEDDENYIKQTYRNRCEIYGANGKQTLSIPIKKIRSEKTNIKDIVIDYDTNWQKNHWKSIESAYRNSPFFEYYIDYILPFYKNQYEYILAFNTQLLKIIMELLEINKELKYINKYQKNFADIDDYRYSIHPKKDLEKEKPEFNNIEYYQVFKEKHGFIGNLSIIDLIFNEGPNAINFLDK